jgi:hypothetical protein
MSADAPVNDVVSLATLANAGGAHTKLQGGRVVPHTACKQPRAAHKSWPHCLVSNGGGTTVNTGARSAQRTHTRRAGGVWRRTTPARKLLTHGAVRAAAGSLVLLPPPLGGKTSTQRAALLLLPVGVMHRETNQRLQTTAALRVQPDLHQAAHRARCTYSTPPPFKTVTTTQHRPSAPSQPTQTPHTHSLHPTRSFADFCECQLRPTYQSSSGGPRLAGHAAADCLHGGWSWLPRQPASSARSPLTRAAL